MPEPDRQPNPSTEFQIDAVLSKAGQPRGPQLKNESKIPELRLSPGTTSGLMLAERGELASMAGSVLRASVGSERRTILVTSANRGEGKTTIATNVAYSLAQQAGARTVVVDANLHSPRLHDLFGVEAGPGVESALMGRLGLDSSLRASDQKNLYFMTLGDADEGFLTLFNPLRVRHVLEQLARTFHVVIFDGPPIFGPDDPAVIAGCFNHVLLVVECESTRWEVVQSARDRIKGAGGPVTGVVLNRRQHYIPQGIYNKIR